MKGSMTVEAAFVIPFSFMVIGVICFLGIFQYNRTVLFLSGQECILQETEKRNQSRVILEESILLRALKLAEARTIAVDDIHADVKMTGGQVVLCYYGKQQLIFGIPLEVQINYQRIFPEELLRIKKYIGDSV